MEPFSPGNSSAKPPVMPPPNPVKTPLWRLIVIGVILGGVLSYSYVFIQDKLDSLERQNNDPQANADSSDWSSWNQLAFYGYKHHDFWAAQKAMKVLGDHWMGEVWPKAIFDQAAALLQNPLDDYWQGVPCPNHCLQLGEGNWIHMHVDGHPDTDLWTKYFNDDGTWTAWTQAHVGQVVEKVNGVYVNQGVCPVCHGKGWVLGLAPKE
jgi:hypothetical protein